MTIDVLHIEDDFILNRVMSAQLQSLGFCVRSATTGKEAIAMINERVPSVLILDVDLPDLSGFEIVAMLREQSATSNIPLIVHTSLDLSVNQKQLLALGPTRWVTKSTAFSEKLGELIAQVSN